MLRIYTLFTLGRIEAKKRRIAIFPSCDLVDESVGRVMKFRVQILQKVIGGVRKDIQP